MKYVPMNSSPTEYKQNKREILSLFYLSLWHDFVEREYAREIKSRSGINKFSPQ